MKSVFATSNAEDGPSKPIANPFGDQYSAAHDPLKNGGGNMVLRSKKGDRSVEVELPRVDQGMTDFVIPVSPDFQEGNRGPASENGVDESFRDRKMSYTDREIVSKFPQGLQENMGQRKEIEDGLGLQASDDPVPSRAADTSYLANIDVIKQLYKGGRYEAALLEVDEMIRVYPTDPKLYAMRGTLLDRLGKVDLAIRSWTQSLRFDPNNQSLKKFVERRQQKRSLAGQ